MKFSLAKKIFLITNIICMFGFSFLAQAQEPQVITPQTASGNPTSSFEMGAYTPLAPLPGFTKVIDGNIAEGGAGSFTLASYVKTLVRIAIGIIGILAVVMIVISGVQYMGSGMITEKEAAKSRLTGAIMGLLLAVSSVLILRTINPQLTTIQLGVFGEGRWCEDNKLAIVAVQTKVKNKTKLTTDEQTLYDKAKVTCAVSNANTIEIPEDIQISGGDMYLKETGQYTGSGPNVTKNITTYDATMKQAANEFNISCTILKAHAYAESNMNPKATSRVGAKGLIQIMPKTFAGLVKEQPSLSGDLYDPKVNMRASAYYINLLVKGQACTKNAISSCKTNPYSQYDTAAYNGGPSANNPGSCGKTKWECKDGARKETFGYVNHVWANIEVLNKNGWGC